MKVIEFLGMPRAGKTTAIEIMETVLKRERASVRMLYEGARISPLDKSDRYNYNAWSFHNTVNRILEARLDHYDFILIDRGILDHASFLNAIAPQCSGKDIESSLGYYFNFIGLQDQEIIFRVTSEEAIRREGKHKPFLGRIFEKEFLENLARAYENTATIAKKQLGRNPIYFDGNMHLEENIQRIIALSKEFLT